MATQALLPLMLLLCSAAASRAAAASVELDDWSWSASLGDGGTWLVKFYAPWCPACRQLEPAWRLLADRAGEVAGLRVAEIDVAKSQVAGGVFLITRLPTVYLCTSDGSMRQISTSGGSTTAAAGGDHGQYEERLVSSWLEAARSGGASGAAAEAPLAWYRSPTAPHMRALGWLIRGALSVKTLHEHLTGPQVGMSTHLAYIVILCAGIAFGVGLVLILVCTCERLCPPEYQEEEGIAEVLLVEPAEPQDGVDSSTLSPDGSVGANVDGDTELRQRPSAVAADH